MSKRLKQLSDIRDVVERVNSKSTGVFLRVPELITILRPEISKIIGDTLVYISEFVIAKIKCRIPDLNCHPEITDKIILGIPKTLNQPSLIYLDKRVPGRTKFIFIDPKSTHFIVVETSRLESGKSEINSIIPIGSHTLKQLGNKFQVVLSC